MRYVNVMEETLQPVHDTLTRPVSGELMVTPPRGAAMDDDAGAAAPPSLRSCHFCRLQSGHGEAPTLLPPQCLRTGVSSWRQR